MRLVYVDPRNCNSTNHYELAPFKFDKDELILDKDYYHTIKDTWMEDALRKDFSQVWIEDDVRYLKEEPCDNFFKVYHRNYEFYFADHWAHVVKGMHVIRFSQDEEEYMRRNDFKRLKGLISRLDMSISDCIDSTRCTGAFVKLGSSSTKHDYPPEQVFSGEEALHHLLGSNRIKRFLSCGVIIVTKWHDDITHLNEFRVFIKNHKVIGVSQQFVYESIPFSYETVYQEITKDIQDLWDKISPGLEYRDAILDIWLSYDMKPNLIEINPYGPWTGAGSSLFHWNNDPVEKQEPEFRITKWDVE